MPLVKWIGGEFLYTSEFTVICVCHCLKQNKLSISNSFPSISFMTTFISFVQCLLCSSLYFYYLTRCFLLCFVLIRFWYPFASYRHLKDLELWIAFLSAINLMGYISPVHFMRAIAASDFVPLPPRSLSVTCADLVEASEMEWFWLHWQR